MNLPPLIICACIQCPHSHPRTHALALNRKDREQVSRPHVDHHLMGTNQYWRSRSADAQGARARCDRASRYRNSHSVEAANVLGQNGTNRCYACLILSCARSVYRREPISTTRYPTFPFPFLFGLFALGLITDPPASSSSSSSLPRSGMFSVSGDISSRPTHWDGYQLAPP